MNTSFLTKSFLLLLLCCTLISCGNSNKTAEDTEEIVALTPEQEVEKAMYNEVMDIHDEVMPKMEDIMSLKTSLEERATTITKDSVVIIEAAISELEKADESMMEWMRNFDMPDMEASHEEVIQYYKEQKAAIIEVKESTLNALEKGTELL